MYVDHQPFLKQDVNPSISFILWSNKKTKNKKTIKSKI